MRREDRLKKREKEWERNTYITVSEGERRESEKLSVLLNENNLHKVFPLTCTEHVNRVDIYTIIYIQHLPLFNLAICMFCDGAGAADTDGQSVCFWHFPAHSASAFASTICSIVKTKHL